MTVFLIVCNGQIQKILNQFNKIKFFPKENATLVLT